MEELYDILIIGSGPVGLAAAVEARTQELRTIVLDRGVLCNSIFNFPTFMRFFTTADLLEIGGHPFPSTSVKPTRQQALDYYRRVAQLHEIDVRQHHEVESVTRNGQIFEVSGNFSRFGKNSSFVFHTKNVILATGYYDNPVGLGGIPGEDLPHVAYYYSEPHGYYNHEVVIIGAGNSGAEAALELYRHGAKVTLVHKAETPKNTLKYWLGPDLNNRIANGEIKAVMPAETVKIDDGGIIVLTEGKEQYIPADQIFVLTGFTPDMQFINSIGVEYDPQTLASNINKQFESNVNGLYLVGSVGFGKATNSVFIENGREHAVIAVQDIAKKWIANDFWKNTQF